MRKLKLQKKKICGKTFSGAFKMTKCMVCKKDLKTLVFCSQVFCSQRCAEKYHFSTPKQQIKYCEGYFNGKKI